MGRSNTIGRVKNATKAPQSAPALTTAKTVGRVNPPCAACHCEESTADAELQPTDYAGQLDDGTRYTTIRRQLRRCDNCGQTRVEKIYEFDPESWKD